MFKHIFLLERAARTAVVTKEAQGGGGISLHNRNVAVRLPDVRHYPLALFAEGDVLGFEKTKSATGDFFCNG